MMMLSGICLQGLVASVLLRPVEYKQSPQACTESILTEYKQKLPHSDDLNTTSKAIEQIQEGKGVPKESGKHCSISSVTKSDHFDTRIFEPASLKTKVNNSRDQTQQGMGKILEQNKTCTASKWKAWVVPYVSLLGEVPSVCGLLALMLTFTLLDSCIYVFLPALAIDHGSKRSHSVLLITWAGISDTLSRIVFGIFMDVDAVRPRRIYLYCCLALVSALITSICPLIYTNSLFMAAIIQ